MEILILSIIIGLLPAKIASNKGYNFILYWICGTLMFIIALPWTLIMKPNIKTMRKCTKCLEWIDINSKICKYCKS